MSIKGNKNRKLTILLYNYVASFACPHMKFRKR